MRILFIACLGLCLTLPENAQAQDSVVKRPNVILVLADDLGLGDLGCTNPGSRIATPNLDALAASGIVFSDAHSSSSVCTPTRYGLMTGRYNWRSRLARGVLGGYSEHLIPAQRATVASVLGGAGYETGMVGKWHLGWDWGRDAQSEVDFTAPITSGPDSLGFDYYHAFNGSLDMPPYVWVENGRATGQPDREAGVKREEDRYGWYRKGPTGSDFDHEQVLPHVFSKANAFVTERVQKEAPFFLYLALPAPHTPILPLPPFAGASEINPYADFVMQIDHHMGELLANLERHGARENTLVIFTSDNGCSPEANFTLLAEHGHDPSRSLRGHKADIYEGGHRVPLLAAWPEGIPPGQSSDQLACLTDVMATLADMADVILPAAAGEDSISLWPALRGKGKSGARKNLVSHSVSGRFAIRKGPWKLCLCSGSGGWSYPREGASWKGLPPLQLYNLVQDPGERHNVASARSETVRELMLLLDEQVHRGRSTPGPNQANDRDVQFLPEGVSLPEVK